MPASREITFVGSFPSPFSSVEAKRRFYEDVTSEFFPDIGDMLRVARQGFRKPNAAKIELVHDIWGFLDVLHQQPQKSIARVYIITHGSPGLISFSGTIEVSGPKESVPHFDSRIHFSRNEDAGLSLRSIEKLQQPARWPKGGSLDEARRRFTAAARLYVYSCYSGTGFLTPSRDLLEKTANLFQVRTLGLSDVLGYFVTNRNDPDTRWKFKVCAGSCTANNAVQLDDFHAVERAARRLGKLVDIAKPKP